MHAAFCNKVIKLILLHVAVMLSVRLFLYVLGCPLVYISVCLCLCDQKAMCSSLRLASEPTVVTSSRTDRGVHALCTSVHSDLHHQSVFTSQSHTITSSKLISIRQIGLHHLMLPEAVTADLAQNRPLWKMMSTCGTTQS